MENKKRYAVTVDFYIYADDDYMARKKAHEVSDNINGDHTNILNITDAPFASMQTRDLEDISKPLPKDEPLPF
jgi:hypothetical protein